MADVALTTTTNETEVTSKAVVSNGGAAAVVDAQSSKSGPSSKSPTKSADDVKTAMQHLAAGKRSLLVEDFNAAEASLSQACEMFANQYGEMSIECAEPLFLYGKALLELARVEAGVINNGLDGVPEDDTEGEDSQVEDPEKCTEEEKEEISQKVGEALEENFSELEKVKTNGEHAKPELNGDKPAAINGKVETNGKKKTDESEEQNSTEEEGEDEEGDEAGEGEDGAGAEGEEEGEDEPKAKEDTESIGSNEAGPSAAKDTNDVSAIEAEEEDDPSNLQRAWEMLEMAKLIYSKHIDTLNDSTSRGQFESQLSETYQKLGEVSIENEDYKQAIEDLTTCLKLRQKLLPEDSRCIAETHYQLGVALGFYCKFDEAVKSLNAAIDVLQKRIENLKTSNGVPDPAKAEDAFYSPEREIAEIESLIPEIREKISDTEDLRAETSKKIEEKMADEEQIKSDAGENGHENTEDSGKSASNISHLVKKRKKSSENGVIENGDTLPTKKAHVEVNGRNGSQSNGN